MLLHEYLEASAARFAERTALHEPGKGEVSYRELGQLSDRVRERLQQLGVRPGDRVGLFLRKSIDAVASIFGIMKAGAAYVPVDADAPYGRGAYILKDCAVAAVIVEARHAEGLQAGLSELGAAPLLLVLAEVGGGAGLLQLDAADRAGLAETRPGELRAADALAYILYTSGSTGSPKGVMLSHLAGTAWVEWASQKFQPEPEDRFSAHAPFHFDLSTFDLFVAIRCGAAVVLIGEELAKEPMGLARLIAETRISVWYSAPSILSMMVQVGRLESYDFSALRLVLFAGEVFPIARLRSLTRAWPRARYVNLYGPTETNVCTYHEAALPIPDDLIEPLPIGKVCENLHGLVIDTEGRPVARGEEGELVIAGPNVMLGYWQLPEQNQRAFFAGPDGRRYYRTGDRVMELPDGVLQFNGRRDRMVKRRGFRVELGEIEACLYRHPEVVEAAVVAIADQEVGVRIRAHLVTRDGIKLSIIKLKTFCSEHVPVYMIPDSFTLHPSLPKTSTDKTDYQRLTELG